MIVPSGQANAVGALALQLVSQAASSRFSDECSTRFGENPRLDARCPNSYNPALSMRSFGWDRPGTSACSTSTIDRFRPFLVDLSSQPLRVCDRVAYAVRAI